MAQPSSMNGPKPFVRKVDTYSRVEDTLKKQFASKNLAFPPAEMYVR
ncbi:MAG: hypothetical protein HY305_04605, partial [Sphingobacteriales bacterium]|nr:hypothetical protein [Sphingobacteriales bacterium]